MASVLAIQLDAEQAVLAVVAAKGERPLIEATQKIVYSSPEIAVQGSELAAGIDELGAKRLATVVVLPRKDLLWQTFQLPPSPDSDLPALVAMQAERDQPLAVEEEGFDFLPLSFDEEHPRRVIGVSLAAARFKELQKLLETAGVHCQRLVPRPLGWRALAHSGGEGEPASRVTAAVEGDSATIISEQGQLITRLRTIPLPPDAEPDELAKVVTGELRRTSLSMTQEGAAPPHVSVWFDGTQAGAENFRAALPTEFTTTDIASLVDLADEPAAETSIASLAPLAGLALEVANGQQASIDLLHPRKPPAVANRNRTYALAGVAAVALASLLAWKAYRDVQTPLETAEVAQSQLAANEQLLESYAEDEKQHAIVQKWHDRSVDILEELDHTSQQLRPVPLTADDFPQNADIMAKSVSFDGIVLTLTAMARDTAAVQPLENRLRKAAHRVTRQKLQRNEDGKNGYVYDVVEVIDPEDEAEEDSP